MKIFRNIIYGGIYSTMIFQRKKTHESGIDPDEIFLDSSNLPHFDTHQFEGRLEKPISKTALVFLFFFFVVVVVLSIARLSNLELAHGESFRAIAEGNRLLRIPLFAERGVIFDRAGRELAWNEPFPGMDFAARSYADQRGLAHVLGFVNYPAKDSSGFYYKEKFGGMDGVERAYDGVLSGANGVTLVETDAKNEVRSMSSQTPVRNGENLVLSIDARVTEELFSRIESTARESGFEGGAGVILDIRTGEILALASFPSYDPRTLTSGDSDDVRSFLSDTRTPFLNRVVSGLYTPGSIVKPFLAMAALQEQLISPEEKILSTGSIAVPNPYLPGEKSVFLDWKAHGWVSMRDALAVSSNVYFYEIAGGYEKQKGLGIGKVETYMNLFGFGKKTGVDFLSEETGVIPTPHWKAKIFKEEWRLGDTYNTAIGQYGFQVTPLQAVRAVAAIANGGKLLKPRIVTKIFSDTETINGGRATPIKWNQVPIDESYYPVVREGMRLGVLSGTAKGLDISAVPVAAKTGTAQVGTAKKFVHSWVTGFFPYENPRYAFAVVMEHGPSGNLIGALYVFRGVLEWMAENTPEYLK